MTTVYSTLSLFLPTEIIIELFRLSGMYYVRLTIELFRISGMYYVRFKLYKRIVCFVLLSLKIESFNVQVVVVTKYRSRQDISPDFSPHPFPCEEVSISREGREVKEKR